MTATADTPTAKRPDRRLLNAVLVVGIVDAALLVVLLYFAVVDRSDTAVSILGPIHGIGYLLLLGLTGRGAMDDQWGWWFPALVLVTGGPIGSLIGEVVLRKRLVGVAASLMLFALLAVPAQAAEVKLKCAGPGQHNVDSSGEISCAANPGKPRFIAGTVRNDAGQPVATKVTVTRSPWILAPNSGYHIKAAGTTEITSKADGTFRFKASPKYRESFRFDVAADPAVGIAAAVSAEAEVMRRLVVKVTKLGGGRVRLAVAGTKRRPLTVTITYDTGYQVPGVRPKKVSRAGKVTFNLGATTSGKFSYYVDAGRYQDLFWYEQRKVFRLRNGG